MNNPANSEKLKILIAEDDEDLLALYDKALPDALFDKRLVRDGTGALAAYKEWSPDILIVDIMMPIKTGCSVIKEIRGIVGNGHTTIVISTSIDDIKDVRECSGFGVQGHIVKPFNYKKLAQEILEYYKKKEPERAANALSHLESVSFPH